MIFSICNSITPGTPPIALILIENKFSGTLIRIIPPIRSVAIKAAMPEQAESSI
jgi:hypothetical protein